MKYFKIVTLSLYQSLSLSPYFCKFVCSCGCGCGCLWWLVSLFVSVSVCVCWWMIVCVCEWVPFSLGLCLSYKTKLRVYEISSIALAVRGSEKQKRYCIYYFYVSSIFLLCFFDKCLHKQVRTWTNMDEHGRTWTNLDELGRTWTNMDEHRRT